MFQRADGLWVATITVGHNGFGKRRRRTVYGKTKREAMDKAAVLAADKQRGEMVEPNRMTVGEYLDHWLENIQRPTIREATYISYEQIIRNHLKPHLGGSGLQKLTPIHIQTCYAAMEKAGTSPRVRQLAHAVLRCAMKRAVKLGLVLRNVCDAVDAPRVPRAAMSVLNSEQVAKLLEQSNGTRYHALMVLAVTTGLRQGELLGLQWSDIDIQKGTLAVQRALIENNGKVSIGEPKTEKGRRSVTLPTMALQALAEHRRILMTEGNAGSLWVFPNTKGGTIGKGNLLSKVFRPMLKRAGLPPIRFHDLRHTAATLLLAEGVHPKVVQERLGHSQIGMTLDTYSHVLPTMQQDAADRLDRLFNRSVG